MFFITQWGYSALMMAAREGRTDVVSLLLDAGANIDLQDKVISYTLISTKTVDIPPFHSLASIYNT